LFQDLEKDGRVSSTKFMQDSWNHMEGQLTKAEILSLTGQRRIQDIVGERRLRFAGHILRMTPECPGHCAMDWTPFDGKRRRGPPKKSWRSSFLDHLQARGEGDSSQACTLAKPAADCSKGSEYLSV